MSQYLRGHRNGFVADGSDEGATLGESFGEIGSAGCELTFKLDFKLLVSLLDWQSFGTTIGLFVGELLGTALGSDSDTTSN